MSSDARQGLVHSSRFTESGLRVADDVLGLIEKNAAGALGAALASRRRHGLGQG